MKILIVVTSISMYESGKLETGLWLSELTHVYDLAHKAGYKITVASTKGGNVPIDPESLKPIVLDKMTKEYYNDSSFMELLKHTKSLSEVQNEQFDVVVFSRRTRNCVRFSK
jgi:putative intracellular protease/amidase